ncbi:hypothetical protein BGZ54_002981 [Gamsiella multidivaricata]|nr:hypothetical protein BGZ54_002981 [Gamsiella multidivaricata]
MQYPASTFPRSVATQLLSEVKRHYKHGSVDLEKKLQTMKAKGLVADGSCTKIDDDIPAIENFMLLNRSSKSFRRFVPLTGTEQPFVSFSERELGILFWHHSAIKGKLQEMMLVDFEDKSTVPARDDFLEWLQTKPPGFFITEVLSNIGKNNVRKGRRGFKDNTSTMGLTRIRAHVQHIQHPNFDPRGYSEHGYVLRGGIRTDGHRLQLVASKLKELQAVRYKRLPTEVLLPRAISTIGGVDFFLSEIRNVVRTPQDVAELWGCDPQGIKVLGIDMGQACVIGASAILPKKTQGKTRASCSADLTSMSPNNIDAGINMQEPCDSNAARSKMSSDSATVPAIFPPTFYNLAVKQKAVYQPMLKHRRWMNQQKGNGPISAIESELPALRGENSGLADYLNEYDKVKHHLDVFYNGHNHQFKKHRGNA